MKPSRQAIIDKICRYWPGLIHFGVSPLCISAPGALKSMRVSLLGEHTLHLRQIRMNGASREELAQGQYVMSSMHASSGQPQDLVLGPRSIHTLRERMPFWQVSFAKPVQLESIEICNRIGQWASRAYSIYIEFEFTHGSVLVDWLDPDRLSSRAQALWDDWQAASRRLAQLGAQWLPQAVRDVDSALLTLKAVMTVAISENDHLQALASARAGLVRAILDLVDHAMADDMLGNAPRRQVLEELRELIDSLCLRPPYAGQIQSTSAAALERHLAATFLAAEVARKGHAALDMVEEYGHFVQDASSLLAVEDHVNGLLSELGPIKAELPVVFRAHGLAGSSLHSDKNSYLESMVEVAEVLEKLGYQCGICYGTYLGAVRDGGFIPHDDDVDMAVVLHETRGAQCRQELEDLLQQATASGLHGQFCEGHDFLKLKSARGGRYVDVFPISPDADGSVWMFMQQLKLRPVQRDLVLPMREMDLYGRTYWAPATIDGFLTDRYGADWKVSQRFVGTRRVAVPNASERA